MYALQTGSPSFLSSSSLMAIFILKHANFSKISPSKLLFIVISPSIICICFISLSSLYPSNLPFTALS